MSTALRTLVVLVALTAIGGVAFAQDPWQTEGTRCVRKGRFEVSKWEIGDLRLAHSSMNDVEKSIGPGKRVRIGSDAVSAEALCYDLGEGQVVVFESGPLGGSQDLLTAVSVLRRTETPFFSECGQPARELKREISRGRLLGAARESFERTAGDEYCHRSAATTEWNFEREYGGWTTLSGLHASFEGDRLRWWRVYSVTSH